MLDVFKSDAFGEVTLTDSFIKAPYVPGRIGKMGLFRSSGIRTTTVVVEEKDGRLELIQTSPRGGPATTIGAQKRTARSFIVPHLEKESKVMADEVQGVRQFGSENAMEAVQSVVNERLADLRQMHEATLEHLRIGAIKGTILDADGSTTIYNLHTEFGVTQQTVDIALSSGSTDVRGKCTAIVRASENELGGEPASGYVALCGDAFFDDLIKHDKVVESLKYQESRLLRSDVREGFDFGGINWINYRGSVGGTLFMPTAEARVVPLGTGIFRTYYAPADFVETVNTVGLPGYAKIAEGELNRWAKIHTQSNPLAICLRPRAVIKVTKS